MIQWPDEIPVLSDGVITLRGTVPSDAQSIFDYIVDDPEIHEYTTVPLPYLREYADEAISNWAAWFAAKEVMQFAIVGDGNVGDGAIIGQITLHHVNHFDHYTEIGYLMSAAARGRGYISRAISLVSDYCFEIGFRRVEAIVATDNPASQRVVEKCGFVREAELISRLTNRDGSQSNAVMFRKLATELPAYTGTP